MTGFQKGTNDRPQNEAGTFALRLAVEKTETIGPSDHANQRNQVTRPGPAGAGLAGPAGTPCASWYDSGQAGRACKPFTVGWIGKVKTPWTADRAMTTVAWPYSSQHAVQYCAPWGTVGCRGSAMTHVVRWFKCLWRRAHPCPEAILYGRIPTGWLSNEDSECHDAIWGSPSPRGSSATAVCCVIQVVLV